VVSPLSQTNSHCHKINSATFRTLASDDFLDHRTVSPRRINAGLNGCRHPLITITHTHTHTFSWNLLDHHDPALRVKSNGRSGRRVTHLSGYVLQYTYTVNIILYYYTVREREPVWRPFRAGPVNYVTATTTAAVRRTELCVIIVATGQGVLIISPLKMFHSFPAKPLQQAGPRKVAPCTRHGGNRIRSVLFNRIPCHTETVLR